MADIRDPHILLSPIHHTSYRTMKENGALIEYELGQQVHYAGRLADFSFPFLSVYPSEKKDSED